MKNLLFLILFLCQSHFYGQQWQMKSIDGSTVSIEALLQQYVQIPSVSGQEKEAGDFIKTICRNNGLYITEFGNINGQYNFAASAFPLSSNKPNIIFLNHIDVVPENESTHVKPYSGLIEDELIYGRGTIDNKGAAMMQLSGMISFINNHDIKDSPYNITFLSVSCEETQCDGGISYVNENYFEALHPVVVFGEGPTEISSLLESGSAQLVFGISVVHKKPLWLELQLESQTLGHGSITPLDYPNKELVHALNRIIDKKRKAIYNDVNTNFLKDLSAYYNGAGKMALKHPRLFRPVLTGKLRSRPELFALFSNTITLTNMHSNTEAVNKLASIAYAHLDCRLLPETNEQEFLAMIRKRLKNDQIKINVLKSLPGDEVSSKETIFYKNFSLAIKDKYPNAATMSLMMPNVSDLGSFRSRHVPAYGSIPIIIEKEEAESIHGKEEHLHIKALYDGAEVYQNFLERMVMSQ